MVNIGNTKTYRKEIEKRYKKMMKKKLNLDNPLTFNEKIQWLKLYDSTPIKTRLADKYLVREWVKETIGEEYLIPLLGVYDKFDEIDFNKLPDRFVIKCNHGCAYNIIVKDKSKLNISEIKQKVNKWMNENYYKKYKTELHYRDIKPKIIIEKFIEDKNCEELNDYKFFCFNGDVKYVQVISERKEGSHKVSFYDKNWMKQIWYNGELYEKAIIKPKKLNLMIKLAEKLSNGHNFVRVDLYHINDETVYFGEMTFTPASGTLKWSDETINKQFGEWITLPKLAYNIDTGEYYELPQKQKGLLDKILTALFLRS